MGRSLGRGGGGGKGMELKISQLSWTPLFGTVSYEILSSRSLNRTESSLLKFKVMTQPSLGSKSQNSKVGEKKIKWRTLTEPKIVHVHVHQRKLFRRLKNECSYHTKT